MRPGQYNKGNLNVTLPNRSKMQIDKSDVNIYSSYQQAANTIRISANNSKENGKVKLSPITTFQNNLSFNEGSQGQHINTVRFLNKIFQPIQPYIERPQNHPLIEIGKPPKKKLLYNQCMSNLSNQPQVIHANLNINKGINMNTQPHSMGVTMFYPTTATEYELSSYGPPDHPMVNRKRNRICAAIPTSQASTSNQKLTNFRNSLNQMQSLKPGMELPVIQKPQQDPNIYLQAVVDINQMTTLSKRLREKLSDQNSEISHKKKHSPPKPINKILHIQQQKTKSKDKKNVFQSFITNSKFEHIKNQRNKIQTNIICNIGPLQQTRKSGTNSMLHSTNYNVNKFNLIQAAQNTKEDYDPQTVNVAQRMQNNQQIQDFENGEASIEKPTSSLNSSQYDIHHQQMKFVKNSLATKHLTQTQSSEAHMNIYIKKNGDLNKSQQREVVNNASFILNSREQSIKHHSKQVSVASSPFKKNRPQIASNQENSQVQKNRPQILSNQEIPKNKTQKGMYLNPFSDFNVSTKPVRKNHNRQQSNIKMKIIQNNIGKPSYLNVTTNIRSEGLGKMRSSGLDLQKHMQLNLDGLSIQDKTTKPAKFIHFAQHSRNDSHKIINSQSSKFKSVDKESTKKPSIRQESSPLRSDIKIDGESNYKYKSIQRSNGKQVFKQSSSSRKLILTYKKEIVYRNTKHKLGQGRNGPVELIFLKDDLFALKKIHKKTLDNFKKIQHLKNEKSILEKLKLIQEEYRKGVYTKDVVDGILSMTQLGIDEIQFLETKESSQRQSYLICDNQTDKNGQIKRQTSRLTLKNQPPMPLNYIVNLESTFVNQEHINLIFEYLPGKDLFWVIKNQMNTGKICKEDVLRWVAFYSSQVLCALETLLSYNIIYRDLKPENVMIDRDGSVKLIDFGFAKQLNLTNNFRTTTNCGTLGYTAPEVLLGVKAGYSFEADIWCFGILICELLQQKLPYENTESPYEINAQCIKGEMKLPRGINNETRDLLNCIFQIDPMNRITIDDMMNKPFFKKINWERMRAKDIDPADIPYIPDVEVYNKYLAKKDQFQEISNVASQSKQNAEFIDQTPSSPDKVRGPLGDFTLIKVNKEFENF